MTKKQKKNLIRIIVSAVLMVLLIFMPIENKWLKLALYMIPYFIVGYDILIKAFKGVKNLQPFDQSLWEYGVTVILWKPLPLCFFIKSESGFKAMQSAKAEKIFPL